MIRNTRDAILDAYHGFGFKQIPEPPHQRQKRMQDRIKAELLNVGISPKMDGYQYLTDALELFIQKPQQRLSTTIAKKYGKSKACVEKGMETAINMAWMQTDIDVLLWHYTAKINPEKGVPTVMEFICYFADKLRDEC